MLLPGLVFAFGLACASPAAVQDANEGFSTKPFDISATNLGIGYKGHDLRRLYDTVLTQMADRPSDSAEEAEALSKWNARVLDTVVYGEMKVGSQFAVVADAGFGPSENGSGWIRTSLNGQPINPVFLLPSTQKTELVDTGEITSESTTYYLLVFNATPLGLQMNTPSTKFEEWGGDGFEFDFKVPAGSGTTRFADMRALMVFQSEVPYAFDYKYDQELLISIHTFHRATFYASLKAIVYFNESTGLVYHVLRLES